MAASTTRPGNRWRSSDALPTPFCKLTTTASGGACRAIASAISAVSALLTVTSTTPASAKTLGSSDSVNWRGTIFRFRTLEARQPEPMAFDLLDHARTRQQRDAATGRSTHAADKAADAAGPGHADRSIQDHPAYLSLGSIAEFTARRLSKLTHAAAA